MAEHQMFSSTIQLGELYLSSLVFSLTMEYPPFVPFLHSCIDRHRMGDWGDICSDDWSLNQQSLLGGRLFSSYTIPAGMYGLDHSLWIITEHDRSYTTVLFPSEY